MYPQSALILLTTRKDALRREIAEQREQCATVADRVTQPLAWLDGILMLGHALGSIRTFLFPAPRRAPSAPPA
jgi:hypothetical protein